MKSLLGNFFYIWRFFSGHTDCFTSAIFPGCHITFPGIVLFIAISLPFNCYKGNNKRACHFIAKSLPCFPAISLPYCHIFRMSSSHCPISLLISCYKGSNDHRLLIDFEKWFQETLKKVRIFQDCEKGLLVDLVLKLKLQVGLFVVEKSMERLIYYPWNPK